MEEFLEDLLGVLVGIWAIYEFRELTKIKEDLEMAAGASGMSWKDYWLIRLFITAFIFAAIINGIMSFIDIVKVY